MGIACFVYEKKSGKGKGNSMCSTGIVGMTSKNDIEVKSVFDLRWFVVRNIWKAGEKFQEKVFRRGFVIGSLFNK